MVALQRQNQTYAEQSFISASLARPGSRTAVLGQIHEHVLIIPATVKPLRQNSEQITVLLSTEDTSFLRGDKNVFSPRENKRCFTDLPVWSSSHREFPVGSLSHRNSSHPLAQRPCPALQLLLGVRNRSHASWFSYSNLHLSTFFPLICSRKNFYYFIRSLQGHVYCLAV